MRNKKIVSKIIAMVCMYLVVLIAPSLFLSPFSLSKTATLNWQAGLSAIGALVLILLDRFTAKNVDLEPDPKASFTDIILYGFTGVFLLYAANIVGSVMITMFFGLPNRSQNTQEILAMIKTAPFFAIYGAIVAPIMEELVFRKTLYGLGRHLLNPLGAALISSLLFGLAHNDNSFLIVYAGIGLVLCWLYKRTKSIYVPMVAHALFNTVTIVVSLVITK